jgi:hypothetical protein
LNKRKRKKERKKERKKGRKEEKKEKRERGETGTVQGSEVQRQGWFENTIGSRCREFIQSSTRLPSTFFLIFFAHSYFPSIGLVDWSMLHSSAASNPFFTVCWTVVPHTSTPQQGTGEQS